MRGNLFHNERPYDRRYIITESIYQTYNTNARNFWPNKSATRPASGLSYGMEETYSKQLPFLLEETFQQNPLRCQRSFQTFYSSLCQPPLENQKAKKKVSGFIFPLNEWSFKSPIQKILLFVDYNTSLKREVFRKRTHTYAKHWGSHRLWPRSSGARPPLTPLFFGNSGGPSHLDLVVLMSWHSIGTSPLQIEGDPLSDLMGSSIIWHVRERGGCTVPYPD